MLKGTVKQATRWTPIVKTGTVLIYGNDNIWYSFGAAKIDVVHPPDGLKIGDRVNFELDEAASKDSPSWQLKVAKNVHKDLLATQLSSNVTNEEQARKFEETLEIQDGLHKPPRAPEAKDLKSQIMANLGKLENEAVRLLGGKFKAEASVCFMWAKDCTRW